jgi:hypothetical protein
VIDFAEQELESEFHKRLHPAARAVVVELATFCRRKKFEGITVTGVSRDEDDMARIYGADWKEKKRFSWHLDNRAVDIRNYLWEDYQRDTICQWLKRCWPDAEVLMHDVGQGDHLHIAIPGPWSRYKRLRRYLTKRSKA